MWKTIFIFDFPVTSYISVNLSQIEPVIVNYDIVHHMLLYHCPYFVNETYDKPCYQGDIGDACFRVVAAWGVGGGVRENQVSIHWL